MKQIPNLFTLLNLCFGCLAIIYTLQNGIMIVNNEDGTQYIDIAEKIWYASLFIGLAGIVDFLDGFIARLMKVNSEMGKQLDSLADVVTFGVAPGLIMYQFLRMVFANGEKGIEVGGIWLLPALLIPCAAAYRLARFNLDQSQQYGFKGMPTPAVGLLVASFPLIYWSADVATVSAFMQAKWASVVLYAIIVVLSYLMVSKLPFMGLKFKDFSLAGNWPKLLLVIIAVLAALFLHWLAVPVVFIVYIILSLTLGRSQPQA
ncbi:MAG: phosphatidylcholine/phosphatidylserine synthase [Chitinophagaceae bacterium]